VNCSVAVGTQRDQIALGVIACLASALNVVDLESAQGTASLAAPAIPFEDLLVQPVVGIGTQPNPAAFCSGRFHAASAACCRNSCFSVAGSNRKSRINDSSRILGLPPPGRCGRWGGRPWEGLG